MFIKLIILFVFNTYATSFEPTIDENEFYEKCIENIYQKCSHKTNFSEEEIENAKNYIQDRFMSLSKYKPLTTPCQELHVRKDFKCLTHEERMEVMNVFKILYEKGVMAEISGIHWKYWGQTHKFADFLLWHRWTLNEIEKRMMQINPKVTLPYWSNYEEFDMPHLSIIWDYFGRAGNRFNDHCIKDTVLSNISHCIRRQWVQERYIPSWNPIEYIDSVLQTTHTMNDWFKLLNNPHFKVHLNVGGWMGQMSVTDATYDAIFYPYHDWLLEVAYFKWQLQNNMNLVSETYNEGFVYDWQTKRVRKADLRHDRIIYFNVSVLEVMQVGFGDLCYIHDHNVRAINQLIAKKRDGIPIYYNRLPEHLIRKHFPRFHSNTYTPLDLVSNPVINCNRKCHPIQHPMNFDSTLNGKRLLKLYKYAAAQDISEHIKEIEFEHNEFIADMNSGGYCSPYIIS